MYVTIETQLWGKKKQKHNQIFDLEKNIVTMKNLQFL